MNKMLKYCTLVTTASFLLVFSFISSHASQFTLSARVTQVKDGDTVVVSALEGGQYFVCRLYGIDAPETEKSGKPGQSFGKEAMRELKELILGKIVQVTATGAKTFNREVCLIMREGVDINLEMVRRGYAWAYREYLKRPHASEYIDAENRARKERLGLWMGDNPMPPWEFRRLLRHKR